MYKICAGKEKNMAKEVFNRFEKKYLVTSEQVGRVLDEIEKHMEPDKFNIDRKTYSICNVYFDTEDDYLIRNSLAKPVYKEKIRLRSYGTPDEGAYGFLEIKKKVNGLVNKRRTKIKIRDAYDFVESKGRTQVEQGMNKQVLKELTYIVQNYDLKPKVMIAYDRLAYFEKGNPDLRLSLDTNLRSRRKDVKLEMGSYGENIIDNDIWIMEIKTSKAMPLWLSEMLANEKIRSTSFSKYGIEFKKYIKKKKETSYA